MESWLGSAAMWQMIGLLAELERSPISERIRAGAKAEKIIFGSGSFIIC